MGRCHDLFCFLNECMCVCVCVYVRACALYIGWARQFASISRVSLFSKVKWKLRYTLRRSQATYYHTLRILYTNDLEAVKRWEHASPTFTWRAQRLLEVFELQ